jgi:benzoyl-CoA reductase/2-hydroxyglutaryl-CoA dehydratase subunit BcrC/BadD/HgdB
MTTNQSEGGNKITASSEPPDLVDAIKDRFVERLSPSTMRSRLFWGALDRFSSSRLYRTQSKADKVALSYFINITRDAFFRRGPVVWANLLVPSELIIGLGCIPFYPEIAAATAAALGMAPRFIDRSIELGFSPDACSYHRCALGCAVEGFLPEPDLLLTVNYPCDSAPLSFAYIADMHGAPHVIIDVPLPGRPEGRALLAGQLEETAHRLADFSGYTEKEAEEGLGRALDLSNQALHYLRRVEELRICNDYTLDGKEAMGNTSVMYGGMGSPAGVDFHRLLAEDLEKHGSAGEDSLRLMWMHLKPWNSPGIFKTLDQRGVRLVCEEYANSYWEPMNPSEPFLSLADKIGAHFLVGPVERRASFLTALAEEYRVDGAVHFNHWGCRQSCAGAAQVKQSLQAAGIPTLFLDGDCVDEREYQEGQLSTRLEAFLESLQ